MPFRSSFWALPLVALVVGCTPSIGDKCALSTDCSTLGDRLCDTTQPGGYCTVFGCEPDQCPNSICVAFDPTLDPACGSADNLVSPRFEQTFCMAPCSSNSNCRSQYECIDLSLPANQALRHAVVVDLGAGDGGLGYSVCMAATCGDGIKDALETDVDCGGGTCVACVDRQHCILDTDCLSGDCANGTCVDPGCTSGNQSVDATGSLSNCSGPGCELCGGPSCAPCGNGGACKQNSDCTSNICKGAGDGECPSTGACTCAPGDCTDEKQDGAETDVDCGGVEACVQGADAGACTPGGCQPCGTGKLCNVGSDCVSGICVGSCADGTSCQVQGATCPGADAGIGNGTCTFHCGAPAICFPSDAGFNGSVPPSWLDAGDDGGDGGDGG